MTALRCRRGLALFPLLLNASVAAAVEIEFASVDAARAVLATRDDFVVRLSPFDRAGRLKTDRDVSEAEYLAFVGAAPREWTRAERERVTAAFAAIEPTLNALLPELAAPILLIKTTGAEEGDTAGYTRGNAVIVPQRSIGRELRDLERLLAHEIFHVVSRLQPELRRSLYGTIGFQYCGELELPAELAPRKITNPDGPVNDYCIELSVDGEDVWAVPVLLSRAARYDPSAEGGFFSYLRFALLLVERADGGAPPQALRRGDGPALVSVDSVSGFFEQIGRNTQYIIGPDEILASNFERLVLGEDDAPSPEVLERMRRALEAARSDED